MKRAKGGGRRLDGRRWGGVRGEGGINGWFERVGWFESGLR